MLVLLSMVKLSCFLTTLKKSNPSQSLSYNIHFFCFVLISSPLLPKFNDFITTILLIFLFSPFIGVPKEKKKRNKQRKQGNRITGTELWDSHSTEVFTNFNPCHLHSSLLNSISTRNMMRKIAETIFPHQYPTHTHTDTNTHTLTHTHTHIYIC